MLVIRYAEILKPCYNLVINISEVKIHTVGY